MPTEMSLKEAMGDTGDGPNRTRIEARGASDGKPDGVIFGVPGLEQATEAEQQAFLRRLLEHPDEVVPQAASGPAFTPPPPRTPAESPPPPPTSTPVWTPPPAGDLFDADAALFNPASYRTEPYTMPQGGRVFVHPTSFDEQVEIGKRVLAELRRGGYLNPAETQEEAEQRRLDAKQVGLALTQLYKTLRCARKGPEVGAPPVFDEQRHLAALKQNPGWGAVVEEIATLSDLLSNGKTEAEHLREMLTDFFGRMETTLSISCSKLKTPFSAETPMPEAVQEVCDFLEDFGSSVSALKRQGQSFGNRELQQLALVLGYAE